MAGNIACPYSEKRVRIAKETLLVFAPLAKLLGMYNVKNELEDLAFKWSAPEKYAETARWIDELSKKQEPVVRSRVGASTPSHIGAPPTFRANAHEDVRARFVVADRPPDHRICIYPRFCFSVHLTSVESLL